MGTETSEEAESVTARNNVLSLIDSFVEQMLQIRRTIVGVSISALILAPIAIGLSIYLIRYPAVEDEFVIVSGFLLGVVIVISCMWLFAGIRQYIGISSWNKHYEEYVTRKESLDQRIASHYGL